MTETITYKGEVDRVRFAGVDLPNGEAVVIPEHLAPRFDRLRGNPFFAFAAPAKKKRKAKAEPVEGPATEAVETVALSDFIEGSGD